MLWRTYLDKFKNKEKMFCIKKSLLWPFQLTELSRHFRNRFCVSSWIGIRIFHAELDPGNLVMRIRIRKHS